MHSDHAAKTEAKPAKVPQSGDLNRLREAAAHCRACPLWKNATRTVFGEGISSAKIILVGEQPGDQEDRVGKPFVGPAGRLLDRALTAAGLSRDECYVTNAVKHFKWTPSGKRRLHAKPNAREMAACRPWLEAEIEALQPELIVCLGVSATQQVVGRKLKVTEFRGEKVDTVFGVPALITVHPSSLLRAAATGDLEAALAEFVADLRRVKRKSAKVARGKHPAVKRNASGN